MGPEARPACSHCGSKPISDKSQGAWGGQRPPISFLPLTSGPIPSFTLKASPSITALTLNSQCRSGNNLAGGFAEALNKYGGTAFGSRPGWGMAPATIWSISPARIRSVKSKKSWPHPPANCRIGKRKDDLFNTQPTLLQLQPMPGHASPHSKHRFSAMEIGSP